MCTNYRLAAIAKVRRIFPDADVSWLEDLKPEAWPGYLAAMATAHGLEPGVFGLVPFFSKDGKDFRRTYNARSETADTKPSYRGPWKRRQWALIPMDAFYEPNYESGKPVRWRIERQDGEPFTVAAIWDTWRKADGSNLHSFSMLTINADEHPLMRRFHAPGDEKRSLVIVPPERREDWLVTLDPKAFLADLPAEEFTAEAAPLPPRGKGAAS